MKKSINYPELRMGAKGDLVVQLQEMLQKTGSKIKADGNFTIGTRTALVKYQKANGLEPSGVCDQKTWTKLLKLARIKIVEPEEKPAKKPATKELTMEEKVAILWEEHLKAGK